MVLHEGSALGAPLAYGDAVIAFEARDAARCVVLSPGGVYKGRHGNFAHSGWVGRAFGDRVIGTGGRGWLHLLRPTPELWTRVLRHRTQILYAPDVANIVQGLCLRPGRTVLESGTGSGSLTTSLARSVAPTGRVFTFEFHAQRAQAARCAAPLWTLGAAAHPTPPVPVCFRSVDFAHNKLEHLVRVFVRDTEANGFPASLEGSAHAVFLDLPGPQKVAASACASLRPDGLLCSFSPCIEQVQRMCAALAAVGMVDLRTIEVLDREYEMARRTLQLPAPPGCAEEEPASRKRRREGPPGSEGTARWKGKGVHEKPEEGAEAPSVEAAADATAAVDAAQPARAEAGVLVWPLPEARGHTGYLTFARKPCEAGGAATDDAQEE